VLHVPCLHIPLLSVCCFRHLKGCSFLSHISGCFLTFPSFFLPVNDSLDCIIKGHYLSDHIVVDFDSYIVGSVSAVSDNTCFRGLRNPTLQLSSKSKRSTAPSLELVSNMDDVLVLPSIIVRLN
jgi:hypothetical protein